MALFIDIDYKIRLFSDVVSGLGEVVQRARLLGAVMRKNEKV